MSEEQPSPSGLQASDFEPIGDQRSQAEIDLEAGKAKWDTERQERDQDHANEQKDLQEKLDLGLERANTAEAELAEMTTQMAELAKQLETTAEIKVAPGEVDEAKLDEEEYGEVAKAVNALRAEIKAAAKAPKAAETSDTVKKLQERLDRFEGNLTKIADTSELNKVLDNMDEAYGPEFRNDAQLAVKRYFAQQGFSEGKPPPLGEMSARVEAEYAKLKLAAAEKSADEGGEAEVVQGDPGTGGDVTMQPSTQYRNAAEVAAAMKKDGETAGLGWDND